jgi:pimeloyl-ACP methyl ester carboxylesterase
MSQQSFWLGEQGGATFMHLHSPRDQGQTRATGIIVVPALGHEYTHGYRAMRAFAGAAAAAGFPAVRIDLRGTGNSTEVPGFGVDTWLEDINRAREYLLKTIGLQGVVLVGVRASALLVLESCRRGEGMILWNPCSSGRSFIRELRVLQKVGASATGQSVLESGGLVFDGPLRQSVEGMKVVDLPSPIGNVLLVEKVGQPADSTLAKLLGQCAASLQSAMSDEFTTAFREPHNTHVPLKFIDTVVQWLSTKYADLAGSPALSHASPVASTALLDILPGAIESVMRIKGLFAILTQTANSKSVVLMSNAGSVHHVGPNRLYVSLARTLSEQGIDCLRYDLANLGDSVDLQAPFESGVINPAPDANTPYPKTAGADIEAMISWAKEQGYTRILLAGLCAGAYAAFDRARQPPSPFPLELILINPLTFQWEEGMSLEIPSEYSSIQQTMAYQSALTDWQRWRRFFTGDIDYSLLFRHLLSSFIRLLADPSREIAQSLGLRVASRLTQDLLRIAASGSTLRFYFAERDPGLEILRTAGTRFLERLVKKGVLRIRTISGADHTFKRFHERSELIRLIIEDIGDKRAITT